MVLEPGDPGYPADGPGGRLVVKQSGDAGGYPADGPGQRVMVKEAGQAQAPGEPDEGGIKLFRRK